MNNINQPAFIWQNHAEDLKNNYVKIKFKGDKNNPFGIGTKVIITADDGFKQMQELELVHGFQSSVEPCLIFGVGKRKTTSIEVIWQNGKEETLTETPVNRVITFQESNANMDSRNSTKTVALFTELNNEKLFRHAEDDYNDFKREPLLPHQFTRKGPALTTGDVNGDGLEDYFVGGAKRTGRRYLY